MYPPLPSETRKPWFWGLSEPTSEPPVQATPDRFLVAAAPVGAAAAVAAAGGGLLAVSSSMSMANLYDYYEEVMKFDWRRICSLGKQN